MSALGVGFKEMFTLGHECSAVDGPLGQNLFAHRFFGIGSSNTSWYTHPHRPEFFWHPPQNFLGCQIQWKSNGRMLVSTGNPKNIGFSGLPHAGVSNHLFYYISIKQITADISGGGQASKYPPPTPHNGSKHRKSPKTAVFPGLRKKGLPHGGVPIERIFLWNML